MCSGHRLFFIIYANVPKNYEIILKALISPYRFIFIERNCYNEIDKLLFLRKLLFS